MKLRLLAAIAALTFGVGAPVATADALTSPTVNEYVKYTPTGATGHVIWVSPDSSELVFAPAAKAGGPGAVFSGLDQEFEKAESPAEREAREKAEREAKEKAEKEAREKAEREAKETAEREAREKAEKEAAEKGSTTWHGFSASNPMPGSTEPFGLESFINQRVPLAPELSPNSAEIAKYTGQPNNIWTDGGYDRPWYYSKATDQVLEVSGVKYGTWANKLKLHVPLGATPAPAPCLWTCGGDHHMAIVEPNGEEYDFWAVTKVGEGKLIAGGAGYASNFGTSSGVSEREAGSVAAGFNNMTGVIRPEELAAGHINHALAGPVHLTRSGCHIFPAKGSDGTAGFPAPCQGQLFRLNYTDSEIAAKPWPRWKKTIIYALADFGYRADDSGGGGGFTIKLEGAADRTSQGQPNAFNVALKGEPGLTEATGAGGKAYILNVASEVDWTRWQAIN